LTKKGISDFIGDGSVPKNFNHERKGFSMKNECSRKDHVISISLSITIMLGIAAMLIYEDTATSMSDPNQWFHWAFCFAGLILAIISFARFVPALALRGLFFDPILGKAGFRNGTHLSNWFLALMIGITVVVYELRIESDWLFIHNH
jgi:hypothetical protein